MILRFNHLTLEIIRNNYHFEWTLVNTDRRIVLTRQLILPLTNDVAISMWISNSIDRMIEQNNFDVSPRLPRRVQFEIPESGFSGGINMLLNNTL